MRHSTFATGASDVKRASLALMISLAAVVAAKAQSLPGLKRDLDFDAMMKSVDLDDPVVRLEYKLPTSDGSSIGVHIGREGKPADASFVPTNTSSKPEAEVVSYRLARFLGVSRNYYPVDYYRLGPRANARFREMVFGQREVESDRIANRNLVIKELKADPSTVLGIYRMKAGTKLYPAHSLGRQGEFDLGTPLARAIRATGPEPEDGKITLDGVKGGRPGFPAAPVESQMELARQLSTIFVIDQLLGQWDRFWDNLEASGDKSGRLKLVARDNGGATLDDWDDYETYNRWVSRYDRDLIERLTSLNAFLKGKATAFSGYDSVASWKAAVGFLNASSFDAFSQKLATLVETRVPALSAKYGDRAFFPPKSPDTAALDAADTCEDD